jgi:hypothetical protein
MVLGIEKVIIFQAKFLRPDSYPAKKGTETGKIP